jgi:hypothetical protein
MGDVVAAALAKFAKSVLMRRHDNQKVIPTIAQQIAGGFLT